MTERSYLGASRLGFHRVAYTQWGDAHNRRVVVCVHGLTRNGRDFDALARDLAEDHRVLCPDVVGRGRSDWLTDPSLYDIPQYLSDMTVLIARSGAEQVDWVGTSMGGLIGFVLASMPGSPMVLNDVGPFVSKSALASILTYLGKAPRFADMERAVSYFREIHAQFGPLTDAQWRHIAETSVRRTDDGSFVVRYDPGIAFPFQALASADVDLWKVWDAVTCPVLVLRGATSALLSADTAAGMKARHPDCRVVEYADCGHAPSLMRPEHIREVRDFLSLAG
ncbi:MAG: alpha/beta hydrolase [Alphaproteobacteria bacterium]|nr:alpha/beta hydrolase [Alphaproteobacteria bacterium]